MKSSFVSFNTVFYLKVQTPFDFDLCKKNAFFLCGIHVFNIPIHKWLVNDVEKDIAF